MYLIYLKLQINKILYYNKYGIHKQTNTHTHICAHIYNMYI